MLTALIWLVSCFKWTRDEEEKDDRILMNMTDDISMMYKLLEDENQLYLLKREIATSNKRRNISKIEGICPILSSYLPDNEKMKVVLPFPYWQSKAKELWTERRNDAMKERTLKRETTLIPILSYLSVQDLTKALPICSTWNHAIGSFKLVSRAARSAPIETHGRFQFWMECAKKHAVQQRISFPERMNYWRLVKQGGTLPAAVSKAIQVDVDRTSFPGEKEQKENNNQFNDMPDDKSERMQRILLAYTAFYGNSSYCQGMTFIVAALLASCAFDEELCFHSFYILMSVYEMEMIYSDGMPGALLRFKQLDGLVKTILPDLHQHWRAIELDPSMFSSGWIMTLFTSEKRLSRETVAHVLDSFFMDGWKFFFRVVVTMIEKKREILLDANLDESLRFLSRISNTFFDDQRLAEVHQVKITNRTLYAMEMNQEPEQL